MKNIIYALRDPITNEIRYIGKSVSGLSRPKDHLKPSNYIKETNYKANWIKSLAKENLKPCIEILASTTTPEELNLLEVYYIKLYKDNGFRLTNLTDGGEGSCGRVISEKTRELMSTKRYEILKNNKIEFIPHNKKDHINEGKNTMKNCSKCKQNKELKEFGKNKNNWDGLQNYCKSCWNEMTKDARKRNPTVKLTNEQLKESYKERSSSISDGLKSRFKKDANYAKNISVRNSKAIVGTNIVTGEIIKFKSAIEANEHGFNNTNIGIAIKNNKPYKGYVWKKDITS